MSGQLPIHAKAVNQQAPFGSAAMVAAELEVRLNACGPDGWLVRAVYGLGGDYQTPAMRREELDRRCSQCLEYISGWGRKTMGYHQWVKQRNYRQKKHVMP